MEKAIKLFYSFSFLLFSVLNCTFPTIPYENNPSIIHQTVIITYFIARIHKAPIHIYSDRSSPAPAAQKKNNKLQIA